MGNYASQSLITPKLVGKAKANENEIISTSPLPRVLNKIILDYLYSGCTFQDLVDQINTIDIILVPSILDWIVKHCASTKIKDTGNWFLLPNAWACFNHSTMSWQIQKELTKEDILYAYKHKTPNNLYQNWSFSREEIPNVAELHDIKNLTDTHSILKLSNEIDGLINLVHHITPPLSSSWIKSHIKPYDFTYNNEKIKKRIDNALTMFWKDMAPLYIEGIVGQPLPIQWH